MSERYPLTQDELAMLLEATTSGKDDSGETLPVYLTPAQHGLLRHASQLVLEASLESHRLRFPITQSLQADGQTLTQLAPPLIEERSGDHPRPWRINEPAILLAGPLEWPVLNLSEQGLVVDTRGYRPAVAGRLYGALSLTSLAPLSLSGEWVRLVTPPSEWALRFTMSEQEHALLQQWLFERHQDTFSDSYESL